LWSTQSLSALGSAMTSFALVIWSYEQQGSALETALLTVCSYAPYVLMSIFAGALSDRWDKKRTMLWCDAFAAVTTLCAFLMLKTGVLRIGHLYLLNALNGLMNTVQQPASDVTVSLLTPKKLYQRVSGLRSLSNALVTVLTPVLAAAAISLMSLEAVFLFDLATCAVAMVALGWFVHLPRSNDEKDARKEPLLQSARAGLSYLNKNKGILWLILFLAAINLVASMYNAALPAMLLSRTGGGKTALGLVNTVSGLATLAGSLIVSALPAPKSRVRVICNALLFSMSTENLLLALGRGLPVWCFAAVCGWLFIPVMNTNLDALLRLNIPISMQGRVHAARNTLQFFTIPLGYLLGGALVDGVCEPLMAALPQEHALVLLLGSGKGSGAALLFLIIAFLGAGVCLFFRRRTAIWALEKEESPAQG
jgi:MFS family permease